MRLFLCFAAFVSAIFLTTLAYAAGPNETLYTILASTGFQTESVGRTDTIVVQNVYCEEKSSRKVKCTATQNGHMLQIPDSKLFLQALRGQVLKISDFTTAKKTIYTLTQLECSSRASTSGGAPFYSCISTP